MARKYAADRDLPIFQRRARGPVERAANSEFSNLEENVLDLKIRH